MGGTHKYRTCPVSTGDIPRRTLSDSVWIHSFPSQLIDRTTRVAAPCAPAHAPPALRPSACLRRRLAFLSHSYLPLWPPLASLVTYAPQSLSNSRHSHFAALVGAHARKRKEKEREKEWCGFLSRLESTLDWIGGPCHFFILGISNLETHPIYSLMLHFQIPLDGMLQWCSRSRG